MERYELLRDYLLWHIEILDDEDSKIRGGIAKMQFSTREVTKKDLPQGVAEHLMVTLGHSDGYAMRMGYTPNDYGYDDLYSLEKGVRRFLSSELGFPLNSKLEKMMTSLVED